MYFRFGNYAHADGEVNLTTNRENIYDDARRPIGYRERWTLQGQLQASTPALVSAAQNRLDLAYTQKPVTAGLYFTGGTASPHVWNARNTLGGIRVVTPPGFPDGTRIQFVNARDYVIVLEAEFFSLTINNVIAYTESIEFIGDGGPRLVMIETRNSYPQIQQVSAATGVILVQSGSATGRFYYPQRMAPLLPAYVNGPDTKRGKKDPTLTRDVYTNYQVSWSYTMLLPSDIEASPNYYPRNR